MKQVVKLKPCVKSYIWGGHFFQRFGKSDLDIVSELWELSVRGINSSIIASGEDAGKRLDEVIADEDVGPIQKKFPYFPLLVKLIDAKENLSVQVHPSDEYALKNENSFGKMEMWYVISKDEGSGLYVGFNKDYSLEEIESKLKSNSILECLNFFPVQEGDVFIIKPGTVHAIGAGVRIMEIQQNSDLTYRLYDYLRKDKNGNYRELHIDKALNVIDTKKYEKTVNNSYLLADTPFFKVNKMDVDGKIELIANGDSFITFTFLSGKGNVNDIEYKEFDTFFLPYGKKCEIVGKGTLVVSKL